jgi:hypothetical protein
VTSQLSLLPETSLSPAGLQYQPDFIPEQDEHSIVRHIQSLPLARGLVRLAIRL